MSMTPGEQAAHAAGRRELMDALVAAGLISGVSLYSSGSGQTQAEIQNVVERLEIGLRRENLAGQRQGRAHGYAEVVKDVLRAMAGKKAPSLERSRRGRKVLGLVRLLRRALL
jgi:hypothetical protein